MSNFLKKLLDFFVIGVVVFYVSIPFMAIGVQIFRGDTDVIGTLGINSESTSNTKTQLSESLLAAGEGGFTFTAPDNISFIPGARMVINPGGFITDIFGALYIGVSELDTEYLELTKEHITARHEFNITSTTGDISLTPDEDLVLNPDNNLTLKGLTWPSTAGGEGQILALGENNQLTFVNQISGPLPELYNVFYNRENQDEDLGTTDFEIPSGGVPLSNIDAISVLWEDDMVDTDTPVWSVVILGSTLRNNTPTGGISETEVYAGARAIGWNGANVHGGAFKFTITETHLIRVAFTESSDGKVDMLAAVRFEKRAGGTGGTGGGLTINSLSATQNTITVRPNNAYIIDVPNSFSNGTSVPSDFVQQIEYESSINFSTGDRVLIYFVSNDNGAGYAVVDEGNSASFDSPSDPFDSSGSFRLYDEETIETRYETSNRHFITSQNVYSVFRENKEITIPADGTDVFDFFTLPTGRYDVELNFNIGLNPEEMDEIAITSRIFPIEDNPTESTLNNFLPLRFNGYAGQLENNDHLLILNEGDTTRSYFENLKVSGGVSSSFSTFKMNLRMQGRLNGGTPAGEATVYVNMKAVRTGVF